MTDYLDLSPTDTATVDHWIAAMQATGRVVTRLPFAVGLAQPGQLGSRLATPDPSRGAGAAQWDYEPAPLAIRVLDNWAATSDELSTYLGQFSLSSVVDAAAVASGQAVHQVFTFVGDATAAALGVPPWILWAGLAFGGYYVVTHVAASKRYLREWAA